MDVVREKGLIAQKILSLVLHGHSKGPQVTKAQKAGNDAQTQVLQ